MSRSLAAGRLGGTHGGRSRRERGGSEDDRRRRGRSHPQPARAAERVDGRDGAGVLRLTGGVRLLRGRPRDRRDRRRKRILRRRGHAGAADARRERRAGHIRARRAPPADVSAVDPQADPGRDQRPLCRHRPRPGAHVRHPLRRRGCEADDRILAPGAGRRARNRMDPAAPRRACSSTRSAALRARRARQGGSRAGPRQSGLGARGAARADARLRARAGRQMLTGEHGDDEASGLRRPRPRAARSASPRPTA